MMVLPYIELKAALRMSRNTAEREGFHRKAAEVQGYLDELEKFPEGNWDVLILTTKAIKQKGLVR